MYSTSNFIDKVMACDKLKQFKIWPGLSFPLLTNEEHEVCCFFFFDENYVKFLVPVLMLASF